MKSKNLRLNTAIRAIETTTGLQLLKPEAQASMVGVTIEDFEIRIYGRSDLKDDALLLAKAAWLDGEISLKDYNEIAKAFGLSSLMNCKVIYAPTGRAGEYGGLATNPYDGCSHGCEYCYVPKMKRMKPSLFHEKAKPRENFIQMLEADLKKYQEHGITGKQIFITFSSDPYNPDDNELTRQAIILIHQYGLGVNILSKGGKRALKDLCLFIPGLDSYGATLISESEETRLLWEKNTAPVQERIETLEAFQEAGIHTWVSLEPVVSIKDTSEAIQATRHAVGLYKVGKMNHVSSGKLDIDWVRAITDLVLSLQACGYWAVDGTQERQAGYYIKEDLRKELLKVNEHRWDSSGFNERWYRHSIEGKGLK